MPSGPEKAAAVESYDGYEIILGFSLSVFAALLAINDLGAGKFGDDELALGNDKTSAYLWYQAKGIKESLAEGQKSILESLLIASAVKPEQAEPLKALASTLQKDLVRYKKEKKEILLGSKTVGEANWAQDVNGEMGQVIGAKEFETKQTILGSAGDRFDVANLFLQLSIVAGAIGLLMKKIKMKRFFLASLFALGTTGVVFSVWAYRIAFSAQ